MNSEPGDLKAAIEQKRAKASTVILDEPYGPATHCYQLYFDKMVITLNTCGRSQIVRRFFYDLSINYTLIKTEAIIIYRTTYTFLEHLINMLESVFVGILTL